MTTEEKETPQLYWSEVAELTHARQVELFGFCTCEDGPKVYDDCSQDGLFPENKLLNILETHYAHEVVISRDTEQTKAGEPEKVAAYILECLECDEELIYKQTRKGIKKWETEAT
jgi:hypothetical protein